MTATIIVDVQTDSHHGSQQKGVTPKKVGFFVYMILMHLKIENLDRKLMSTR